MSVRGAFPDRSTVPDKEIIEWLSSSGQHNSIWVTADDDAQKAHAKLIMASNISVLWVNRPRRGLSVLEELQLLSFVIQPMAQLVSDFQRCIYARASFNGRRPKLEQLSSPLTDKKLRWKRIPLQA